MRLSREKLTKGLVLGTLITSVFVGGWAIGLRAQSKHSFFFSQLLNPLLSKEELQSKLSKANHQDLYRFKQNEIVLDGYREPVVFDFAFDPSIQSVAEDLMARYKPDLGAMVVMDASTGRILAMVGENRSFEVEEHPAISIPYPAASVFKVVTATAALENDIQPSSMMAYAGRNHTLYRSQVLKEKVTGWKRICTLKEAFARSLNPVFGRLGVFSLGKEQIQNCSTRFVFNESIPSEFPVVSSKSADPADDYELAEMASGYTQENIITPLHGALIAASVANDGVMMEPYFVNAAYLKSGKPIYRSEPAVLSQVMTLETAKELRTLMRETVVRGTSRKSFSGFFKGRFKELDVGGKTGHLTDRNLKGGLDWFVGFAEARGRKIAISVLTMNKKYWTVKSSYLARRTIETAFTEKKVAIK